MSRKLIALASFFFVALCLMHYFSQRPLSNDEMAVFFSIKNFTYPEIFGRLFSDQAFPRIYLTIIKYSSALFNYHFFALRFFSLISMLGAFYLWREIFRLDSKKEEIVLLSVLAFSFSYYMSFYSSEMKPYATDVLVMALVYLFTRYQQSFADKAPSLKLYLLAIFFPLVIFFSYGGLFSFWVIPYNFFLFLIKGNKKILPLTVVSGVSTLVCFFVLHHIDLKYFMHLDHWHNYWIDYYIRMDSFQAFTKPIWEGTRKIVVIWFGNERIHRQLASPFVPIFIFMMIREGLRAFKRDCGQIFTLNGFLIVLIFELMALSFIGKFPYIGERITLFLAPMVFYVIAQGIESLARIKYVYYPIKIYFIGFLLYCLGTNISLYISFYSS